MADFPWGSSGTSQTTGIASASVAAGAGYLGGEIANDVNLDTHMDLEIVINCSVAPTANKTVDLYQIFSLDGTNYEDGSASVIPTKSALRPFAVRAVTGAQRIGLEGVRIPPRKFKFLVRSNLDQTATLTVTAKTYREAFV